LLIYNTYLDNMKSYKVETIDLVEKVYENIKEMILNRELIPGQKLVQEEMAIRLGVSRTPILSAFSKLEKEWLVKSLPRRGYYINEMSREEKLNLFDIRMRLEPLGARRAAELGTQKEKEELLNYVNQVTEFTSITDFTIFNKHDYTFHRKIMSLSGNPMLNMMISSYNIISLSNQDGTGFDFSKSIEGHKKIANAIMTNDPDIAEEVMKQHIKMGYDRIKGKSNS
jgi:DNA-binding GntR family transcriptional regulator